MNNTWDLLEKFINEFPSIKCKNVNIKDIAEAERNLCLHFSDSYKFFLKNYECSIAGELRIYGLSKAESFSNDLWSVIQNTNFFKEQEKWPDIEDWYIVSTDGSGDPIGINAKGEVWISYHDSGFEQEKLADSFEEFLYKLLTETLWTDED